MKKGIKFFIILLLYLQFKSFMVSETVTFTLVNSIEIALKNNTEIRKLESGIKIAEAQYEQAVADFWIPGINLNANVNFIDPGSVNASTINTYNIVSNASFGPVNFPVLQSNLITNVFPDNYSVGLGISKPLFSGFRLWNSMGFRKINLEVSKQVLHDKKKEVSASIKTLFYSYLFTERNLNLYLALSSDFKTRLNDTQSNYGGGYTSEFEKLTSEVQYKSTIPALIRFSNAISAEKNTICEQMGESDPACVEFIGDFYNLTNELDQDIVFNDALNRAESNNITLKTIDLSFEMSRISRKIDEGAMWPVVTGFFNYNYDYKKQNYMDNTRQWLTEWNAGLELAMPLDSLIPISKAAKQVKEEEGNFERLEWLKKQTEDSIQYGIRNLIDRIGYGRNVIECQLEIMDKARLSYEMALQRYKTWSSPAAEVNGVELTYYQARIDYLGALLDIYTNTVALHRMID